MVIAEKLNVLDANVGKVVESYIRRDGATKVTATKVGKDNWTVEAEIPD